MRTIALTLLAVICTQNFCLFLQQTLAATQSEPVVAYEVADSEGFFRAATSVAKPVSDSSVRVEALLRRMTLEENIGQMTQLEIRMVTNGKDQEIQIDPAKLEKAVVKYGVGSILNGSGMVQILVLA
jgi:hypothetical protein